MFHVMSTRTLALAVAVLGALPIHPVGAQETSVALNGAGWVQFGRVERSEINDIANDYNKNWFQSNGAQVGLTARFDEHWEGGLALGVVGTHLARGSRGQASLWYPFWAPYVGEARVTYGRPAGEGRFSLTMGLFGYDYNPDTKNLGEYLLQGYVYPGAIVSGFGNVFGFLARFQKGGFRNDLILKSETEDNPRYDLSVADVLTYSVRPGVELGAGVNFYRLIANDPDLTTPGPVCPGPFYAGTCHVIDTTGGANDTITGSLAGTKLMARFRIDPKALFGMTGVGGRAWGDLDWVLYGEAALLGVKNYPVVYEDPLRRIPVMVGVNLPILGLLDYLSVEVEYYASKNSSDNRPATFGSWVPAQFDPADKARDDWKWSVNASRTLFGNTQFMAQVANDHLRPGGTHNSPAGTEALTTPKDWHWNFKVAYFF